MKYILIILAAVTLAVTSINAQTKALNVPLTLTNSLDTNADSGIPVELMLGANGVTVPHTHQSQGGLDVGLSVQPFKYPIWLNLNQEFTWQPSFAGATDLGADWSWKIIQDRLYLNTGLSVGTLYDRSTVGFRSGPEASLEYYTSGNVFLEASINYDLFTKDNAQSSWKTADNVSSLFRYSLGIGWAFPVHW